MSFVSRGFHGRRNEDVDSARVPPGQYVTPDFPVLSAGPTPRTPLDQWDFQIVRRGRRDAPLDVGGAPGAAERGDHPRHPLRDEVVEARHRLARASRSTRCWTGSRPSAEYVVEYADGGYTTNLPLADVTGGKAWVVYEYDGEPLPAEHGGPARLLVPHLYFWKSAKWVRGLKLSAAGRARLLGDARLPQLRRPVAGAALLGRLNWLQAEVVELVAGDAARQDDRLRRARLARPPRRPARRRPADRRGRLPGRAELLDRLGARRHPHRADGRAARRRRGLALPDRRAAARRPDRAARAGRRLLRLGARRRAARCCSSAAARASCR